MVLGKILQDCDYTKVCFREDLCPNSIISICFHFWWQSMVPGKILNTVLGIFYIFLYQIMTLYTQERNLKMNMA